MCSVGCDSTTSSRTDGGRNYELLDVEDKTESKNGVPALKSNPARKTGCRLMTAHGPAVDHEERASATTKLSRAIAICLVFMVLETVGGQFAGSLAVLADAAHMLSDVASFAISLLALRASGWVATPQQTFGYFRLEVLGALLSVQIIWAMTGIILYEAFQRLYLGIHIVDGRLMSGVACVGLALNLIMIFILGHGHDHDHGDAGHWHGHSHSLFEEHNHNHDHDHLDGQNHKYKSDHLDGHNDKPKCGCCTGRHKQSHEKLNDSHLIDVELGDSVRTGQSVHAGGHGHDKQPDDSSTHRDGEIFFGTNDHTSDRQDHDHDHSDGHNHKPKSGCCNGHYRQSHKKLLDSHLLEVELGDSVITEQSGLAGGHDNNKHPYGSRSHRDGEHPFRTIEHTCSSAGQDNPCVEYHHEDGEVNCEQKINLPTYQAGAHAAIFALRGEEPGPMKYVSGGGDAHLAAPSEMLSLVRPSREQVLENKIEGRGHKGPIEGVLNINIRGAYLHALGDLIQNIGVLITGLVIWLKPEWQFIDLLCSVVFSMVVLVTTTKMLKDIMWVLMESSSVDLDVEMLNSRLLRVPGVSAVLDLHVWALTPGTSLLSCHLQMKPGAVAREVLHDATEYCYSHHQIKHVTIQLEDAPSNMEYLVIGGG